jgi:Icc-related predicted phosphoesterase
MSRQIANIVAAADSRGDIGAIRQLTKEAARLGAAIALLGNITTSRATASEFAQVLKALAEPRLPVFYIPGPEDAPLTKFLPEVAKFETVYPHVHGVHGMFAMGPRNMVWSGMGGTIIDDPKSVRDEHEALRYPAWELEYRLKFLRELKDYQKIFLFTTSPAHKRLDQNGSSQLAELIKSYNPHLVLVGTVKPTYETIGNSLVVGLGSLIAGHISVIDIRKREVTRVVSQTSRAA